MGLLWNHWSIIIVSILMHDWSKAYTTIIYHIQWWKHSRTIAFDHESALEASPVCPFKWGLHLFQMTQSLFVSGWEQEDGAEQEGCYRLRSRRAHACFNDRTFCLRHMWPTTSLYISHFLDCWPHMKNQCKRNMPSSQGLWWELHSCFSNDRWVITCWQSTAQICVGIDYSPKTLLYILQVLTVQ